MSRLTEFRAHARRMADGGHAKECPWSNPAQARRDSGRPIWVPDYHDEEGLPRGLHLAGFGPEIPPCDGGCISDDDRALFRRLADEADTYLEATDG